MAAFFDLPLDISLAILGEWIEFNDVGRLDSACTSSLFRGDLLAILRDPVFSIRMTNASYVAADDGELERWLNSRCVRLSTIELSLSSLEHWVQVEAGLLATVTVLTFEQNLAKIVRREGINLIHFRTLLSLLPSLTSFDMERARVATASAEYVGILASMTHLKLSSISLDCAVTSTAHLGALVASFHGSLVRLDLGMRECDGPLLELISTTCTTLAYFVANLSDETSGAHFLAAFAFNRLPFLARLQLELNPDFYDLDLDVAIGDAELIDICKHHPSLEVLILPLGEHTTVTSLVAALTLCPKLMNISTKAYSFEVTQDKMPQEYNQQSLFYAGGQKYCKFDFFVAVAPILESDIRAIKSLRPFPICHIRANDVPEINLLAMSEASGDDLMELNLCYTNRLVDMEDTTYFVNMLKNWPFIRKLRFYGGGVVDDTLKAIADHTQHIQALQFSTMQGNKVSDSGVIYMLEKIGDGLQVLHMDFNHHLSRSSLSAVVAFCPMLTTLSVWHTDISPQDLMAILIEPDGLPLLTRLMLSQKTEVEKLMKSSGIAKDSRWWRILG